MWNESIVILIICCALNTKVDMNFVILSGECWYCLMDDKQNEDSGICISWYVGLAIEVMPCVNSILCVNYIQIRIKCTFPKLKSSGIIRVTLCVCVCVAFCLNEDVVKHTPCILEIELLQKKKINDAIHFADRSICTKRKFLMKYLMTLSWRKRLQDGYQKINTDRMDYINGIRYVAHQFLLKWINFCAFEKSNFCDEPSLKSRLFCARFWRRNSIEST